MLLISSALELIKSGETALCLFTKGKYFSLCDKGKGRSGLWKINPGRKIEQVIIYRKSEHLNEIFSALPDSYEPDGNGRYTINLLNVKLAGSSNHSWAEFAGGGQNPVRYLQAASIEYKTFVIQDSKLAELASILNEAKKLSKRYKEITGKPLGITGEVAEFEAAKRLGIELAPARSPGYDASRMRDGVKHLIQIKGRSFSGNKSGQRIGKLNFKKSWDTVVLVLLDEDYEPVEIYEASRENIVARLKRLKPSPDAKETHSQKGALTVSMFRSIAGIPSWKKD